MGLGIELPKEFETQRNILWHGRFDRDRGFGQGMVELKRVEVNGRPVDEGLLGGRAFAAVLTLELREKQGFAPVEGVADWGEPMGLQTDSRLVVANGHRSAFQKAETSKLLQHSAVDEGLFSFRPIHAHQPTPGGVRGKFEIDGEV